MLLTDGANTAGNVDPLDAAQVAKKFGVKIYTIGVGSDGSNSRSVFGLPLSRGTSELDEKSLTEIAQLTGGQYFRARNTEEMEQIYQVIDELEPTEGDGEQLRPRQELYHWPLGLALISGIAWVLLTTRGAKSD